MARSDSAGRHTLEELGEELDRRSTARARALKAEVGVRLARLAQADAQALREPDSVRLPQDGAGAAPPHTAGSNPQTQPSEPPRPPGLTPVELSGYRAALERIRARLLDLSANNKLLHYKHPKGSSLRVVDEVPAQIFAKLLANGSMSFKALAELPRGGEDGTDGASDESILPLFSEGVSDTEPAVAGVSLDPKEQAKEQSKRAQARREAARLAQARAVGINPEYELPATEATDVLAHRDSKLQTLFFPEELEAQLHKIYREAESSLQETGVNRLHLMFGFVRWRESTSFAGTTNWRLAPLVLLPVRLRRGALDPETHTYRYLLERTGEDWSANVTLQEKCRREFGFELPDVDLEEDDNLEQYFARVEAVLRHGPQGWSLQRFVTLGLVSFGKILMWRDLDPANWPATRPIFDSEPLRLLLGAEGEPGAETAADRADADEYPIDDLPAGPGGVPPIIVDADSSQHSTLVDVERGENLVVQGPPGTGKSQTITNLIAAALRHGKKVLFVAEKKAALDVVYSRLAEAKLNDFCVALHSHTSAKKQFLEDLATRLGLRGQMRAPRDVAPTELRLIEARTRLSDYARHMHTPFGAIELTPFEVLWRARRLTDALGEEVLKEIRDLRFAQVTRTTREEIDRRRDAVADFAAAYGGVREEGAVVAYHPWAGIANEDLAFAEVEDLLDAAREWRAAMFALRANVDAVAALASESDEGLMIEVAGASPEFLRALQRSAQRVPPLEEIASDDLPHAILSAADIPQVQAAVAAVDEARAAWSAIAGNWRRPGALSAEEADAFEGSITTASTTFGPVTCLRSIALAADALRAHARALNDAERAVRIVTQALGVEPAQTPATVRATVAAADAAKQLDRGTLDRRCEATADTDDVAALRTLAERAAALRAARQKLDERFAPAFRPARPALERAGRSLATAPRFLPTLFSGAYRRAHALYREMAGGTSVSREQMIRDIRAIVAHDDALVQFGRDPLLARVFGGDAAGIDSPFDKALAAADWHTTLRRMTAPLGDPGGELLRAIWTLPTVAWRVTCERTAREPDAWRAAQRLDETLRAAEACEGASAAGPAAWPASAIETIRERLEAVVGVADDIARVGQHAGTGPEVTAAGLASHVAAVRAAWAADERLDALAHVLVAVGVDVHGAATDVEPVKAALRYIANIRAEVKPSTVQAWLLGPATRDRLSRLQTAVEQLGNALDEHDRCASTVVYLGRLQAKPWCEAAQGAHTETVPQQVPLAMAGGEVRQESLDAVPLTTLEQRLDRALARDRALHGWAHYQRARATAVREGLSSITALIESERLDREHAADAFEAVFFRSLAEALLRAQRALDTFDSAVHQDVQGRFATYDRQVLQLMQRQIAAELASAPPVPGVSGRVAVSSLTEEALINQQSQLQRPRVTIRELFRRSGRAIQTMKPCFLMGPQAVAQYLPAGMFEFDLVVMDEASQMRAEDALGAIARGHQVVIVGDPMQLGPTKFFDKQDDDDELEDYREDDADAQPAEDDAGPTFSGPTVLERSESILLAAAVRFPVRMLRWHYRSRHPKLIAFSNREFYRGQLVVFPTPALADHQDGVFFNRVPDAVYGDRRNEIEAAAVVEAIRRHAQNAPDRSLLVATLNRDQAELIDRLLETAEKDDEDLQAFRKEHEGTREPLVVKNLESVQGDERDVVLVSVTFGRNKAGKLLQTFGPIIQHGGERRLNVLFTRAKHRLEVFCSFDPSELRVGDGSSRGMKVLRDYLRYAQGEEWWAAGDDTGREPDSDFEIAVMSALEQRGYEVRPQIGVAGYFIDIGVIDPDLPGRFILGMECDGATYHSAKSARDRDRLRQQQLEELGWKIHRIWSTDWFRDPVGQVSRVVARIEQLRASRPAYGAAAPGDERVADTGT